MVRADLSHRCRKKYNLHTNVTRIVEPALRHGARKRRHIFLNKLILNVFVTLGHGGTRKVGLETYSPVKKKRAHIQEILILNFLRTDQ